MGADDPMVRRGYTEISMFLCSLMVCIIGSPVSLAEDARSRLRLVDGSVLSGTLMASNQEGVIAFQADGFQSPFLFSAPSIKSLNRIEKPKDIHPDVDGSNPEIDLRELTVELMDGTTLAGRIVGVTETSLILESSIFGKLEWERSQVLSIAPQRSQGELLYDGPNQGERWFSGPRTSSMKATQSPPFQAIPSGITISSNVGLPARGHVQMELRWLSKPSFVIALGTSTEVPQGEIEIVNASLRLEASSKQLVVIRETNDEAVLARVVSLGTPQQNQIELNVYYDLSEGTAVVADSLGRPLSTINFATTNNAAGKCIHISNYGGQLSVDRLRIRRWSESASLKPMSDETVVLTNGEGFQGSLTGCNEKTNELLVTTPMGELRTIPTKDLARIVLNRKPEATPSVDSTTNQFEILLTDQSRIRGAFLPSESDGQKLQIEGLPNPVILKPQMIVSMFSLARISEAKPSDTPEAGRLGVIKTTDCEIVGYIARESAGHGSNAISWKPLTSLTSSPVTDDCSGAMLFGKAASAQANSLSSDTSIPRPRVTRPRKTPPTTTSNPENGKAKDTKTCELAFQTGDVIEGRIILIDEQGVAFESEQTKCEFATHDQMESITFVKRYGMNMGHDERRHLTTIPRQQKYDPPSHMILTASGDAIRGQLIALTHQGIDVTVRQQLKRVATDRVAQIVWLQDRDWEKNKEARSMPVKEGPKTLVASHKFMVHVMGTSGKGITFHPTSMVAGKLSGTSDLFGECSVDMDASERVLFGKNVGRQVRAYRLDPWLLSLARYPKAFLEESQEGTPPESELVGTVCQDFLLSTVDGRSFQLSEQKGKVVVLDFWASWCGPCMQSMPRVEEMVTAMNSDQVVLVAINLQETRDVAQAASAKLGIKSTVALDEDGKVASLLQIKSIPQAIVIDSKGTVTKVIIGGDQESRDQLRTAIFTELRR
jgi:thiol-disulfide isomerase/thioredoxin/small nuclear ribonucleoprotein (snRNP)-like protein